MGWRVFDDLVMEFDHRLPQHVEHRGAALRQMVVAPTTFSLTNGGFRAQPPVAFETFQQGVQRAWTDVVPVLSQLGEHPLADDRALRGVVQDVNLPEAKQDFACEQLGVEWSHDVGSNTTSIVNENDTVAVMPLQAGCVMTLDV